MVSCSNFMNNVEIHINGVRRWCWPLSEILPEGDIMQRTIAGEALINKVRKQLRETVLRMEPDYYEIFLVYQSKMNGIQ